MILKHRRDMRAIAGPDGDLFGDPAWEIALAVFQTDGRESDAALLDKAGLSATGIVGRAGSGCCWRGAGSSGTKMAICARPKRWSRR